MRSTLCGALVLVVVAACGRTHDTDAAQRYALDVAKRVLEARAALAVPTAIAVERWRPVTERMKANPSDPVPRILGGQFFVVEGDYAEAFDVLASAKGLAPDLADPYYAVGNAYFDLLLFDALLAGRYRVDLAPGSIFVKLVDPAPLLAAETLREYQAARTRRTYLDLNPTSSMGFSFLPLIEHRERQAKEIVDQKVSEITLQESEWPHFLPWMIDVTQNSLTKKQLVTLLQVATQHAIDDPAKFGVPSVPTGISRPSGSAPKRTMATIVAEIEPTLTELIGAVDGSEAMRTKAAELQAVNAPRLAKERRGDLETEVFIGYVYQTSLDYRSSLRQYLTVAKSNPEVADPIVGLARLFWNVSAAYMTVRGMYEPNSSPRIWQPDAKVRSVSLAARELLQNVGGMRHLETERLQRLTSPAAAGELVNGFEELLKSGLTGR